MFLCDKLASMRAESLDSALENDWEILFKQGVRLGMSGRYREAIDVLSRVIRMRPDSADAFFNLGVAQRNNNQLPDAINSFRTAVKLRHNWPEAHYNLGNGLRDSGNRKEAMQCFEKAIQFRPNYPKALHNLAVLFLEQGSPLHAENLLRRAVKGNEQYAEGHFALGRVLRRLRRYPDALSATAKAVTLSPDSARYQQKLAELQKLTGNQSQAVETLQTLLRKDPSNLEALRTLAALHHEQGRTAEALTLLDSVIAHRAFSSEMLILRAEIRRTKGELDDAIRDARFALNMDPRHAAGHNLLGVLLFAKGDAASAIPCYEKALAVKPDLAEALNNLGAAYQALRRYHEAEHAIEQAVCIRPNFDVARLNLALAHLRGGRFIEGWQEFEWRFHCAEYRLPTSNRQLWMGENLAGKTILLRSEQGLGDTFQFIRYAKRVKACGAHVIVECQDATVGLVKTCPGVDEAVGRGSPLPAIDVQCPLMSLPRIFRTTVETIDAETPYLFAEPGRVERWRKRLRPADQFVIGIAWQGNRKFAADATRSLPLTHFEQLATIPGVSLVSLQKGDGADQISGVSFAVQDFSAELDTDGPFRDTAAIISACDLVVTSDTSIAHLAGALGKPVWVALSYSPDWRWLEETDRSPWYPTMQLFRQSTPGDWNEVFQRIAGGLRTLRNGEAVPAVPTAPPLPPILAEVAPGELLDKITILEIKQARIPDPEKLANVRSELACLADARNRIITPSAKLDSLVSRLRAANETLWDVEDELRECERQQNFDQRFIDLARQVYVTNDRRAEVKKEINQLLRARFQEVKFHGKATVEDEGRTQRLAEVCAATAWSASSPGIAPADRLDQQAGQLCQGLSDIRGQHESSSGVVIGHFDNPDFVRMGIAAIRKHCGDVPILIADDNTPGSLDAPGSAYRELLHVVAGDHLTWLWTNHSRLGHVKGDLSVIAKGVAWSRRLGLSALAKLSQRCIINRPDWLNQAVDELCRSGAAVLGRGCTHFGWKLRTESMVLDVQAWDRPEIMSELLQPRRQDFAERLVWQIIEQKLGGQLAPWSLLSASRHTRVDDVLFRATHQSGEYDKLAQSLGLPRGVYGVSPAEVEVNYQP